MGGLWHVNFTVEVNWTCEFHCLRELWFQQHWSKTEPYHIILYAENSLSLSHCKSLIKHWFETALSDHTSLLALFPSSLIGEWTNCYLCTVSYEKQGGSEATVDIFPRFIPFSTVSLSLQQDSVHVPVSQRITRALSY